MGAQLDVMAWPSARPDAPRLTVDEYAAQLSRPVNTSRVMSRLFTVAVGVRNTVEEHPDLRPEVFDGIQEVVWHAGRNKGQPGVSAGHFGALQRSIELEWDEAARLGGRRVDVLAACAALLDPVMLDGCLMAGEVGILSQAWAEVPEAPMFMKAASSAGVDRAIGQARLAFVVSMLPLTDHEDVDRVVEALAVLDEPWRRRILWCPRPEKVVALSVAADALGLEGPAGVVARQHVSPPQAAARVG